MQIPILAAYLLTMDQTLERLIQSTLCQLQSKAGSAQDTCAQAMGLLPTAQAQAQTEAASIGVVNFIG
jgi:hypothetical protein